MDNVHKHVSIFGIFRRKHEDTRCNSPEDLILIAHVCEGYALFSVGKTLPADRTEAPS
jgi:hypothetical protein